MAPIKSTTSNPPWLSELLALRTGNQGRIQTAAMTHRQLEELGDVYRGKKKSDALVAKSTIEQLDDFNTACKRRKGGCKIA